MKSTRNWTAEIGQLRSSLALLKKYEGYETMRFEIFFFLGGGGGTKRKILIRSSNSLLDIVMFGDCPCQSTTTWKLNCS